MLEVLFGALFVFAVMALFDTDEARPKSPSNKVKPDPKSMKLTVQIGGTTYELKEMKKKKS